MKSPDKDKLSSIRKALKGSGGLWVREIARRTGLDKSTCSRYLAAMEGELGFEIMGRNKIYRLK